MKVSIKQNKMDSYQKRLLYAINKRESCSLRNHVTVWNSYHTGNEFTSAIRVQNRTVATVHYKLSHDDLTVNIHGGTSKDFDDMMKNDKWEIDELFINEQAVQRCLGTQARRVVNFLEKALFV
jgi:hypothetical protein